MLYNGIEKKVFLKLENILNTYFNTNTYILRILLSIMAGEDWDFNILPTKYHFVTKGIVSLDWHENMNSSYFPPIFKNVFSRILP